MESSLAMIVYMEGGLVAEGVQYGIFLDFIFCTGIPVLLLYSSIPSVLPVAVS